MRMNDKEKLLAAGIKVTPIVRIIQRREFFKYIQAVEADPEWHLKPAPGYTLPHAYPNKPNGFQPISKLWDFWIRERWPQPKAVTQKQAASGFFADRLGPGPEVFRPMSRKLILNSGTSVRLPIPPPLERQEGRAALPQLIPPEFLAVFDSLTAEEQQQFMMFLAEGRSQLETIKRKLLDPERRNAIVEAIPDTIEFTPNGIDPPPFLEVVKRIVFNELDAMANTHNQRVLVQQQEHSSLQ